MTQQADLTWIDESAPYSTRFEDRYFSVDDGREETRAVFLAGNDLPQRWQASTSFQIAELGFGTGLNFFETLHVWQKTAPSTASLLYTSFELYPLSSDEMRRALANWPGLVELAAPLLEVWPCDDFQLCNVRLQLLTGDARQTLPDWQKQADAWYLDGFTPAKNPQLWEADLMHRVFDHTKPGGTFSTYTAAGFVRRNLQAAGFDVRRVPGFGSKRERLQGQRAR